MIKAAAQKFITNYYFYRNVYLLTSYGLWSYFNFLAMQQFHTLYEAIPTVFISIGIFNIGLMIGYTISAFVISRIGYQNNFRFAYTILALAGLIGIMNVKNVLEVFALISVVHGIGAGLYWQGINTFNLREIHGAKRSHILSIVTGWEHLIEVAVPAIFGFIIAWYSYQLAFFISIILYLIAILLPISASPKITDSFDLSEVKRIIKTKNFNKFGMLTFVGGILDDQRAIIFSVLPFVLIGDALNVGLFSSLMGVVGVIVSFAQSNNTARDRIKFGKIGAAFATVSTIVFVYFWSVPALAIRNIIARVGFSMWTPIKVDLDNQIQELILKDFLQESAVEMSFLREASLFISRTFNMLFFAIVFYILKIDASFVLKGVLLISALREIVMLMGNLRLAKHLKIGNHLDAKLNLH